MDEAIKLREHIDKIIYEDKVIIVEGKKDKAALQKFGVRKVIALFSRPLYKVVESVKDKDVVILTDLDREGKKLYSKLNHEFSQRGVRIDNKFRHFLFRKTKLRQIEGIYSYYHKLEEVSTNY